MSDPAKKRIYCILGLWCAILGDVYQLAQAARYLATPGEFPYVVVITTENVTIYTGILITEKTVMTDWLTIAQYLQSSREPIQSYPYDGFRIIASNGDWLNDRKKQTRRSNVVSKHSKFRVTKNIPVNNVALIFVDSPFIVTPYIVPVRERMGSLKAMLNESVSKILKNPSHTEVFVIGGLVCPDGKCEAHSPMFRYTTKLISKERCEKAICGNDLCKELENEEKPLCFEHGGIGGAGSPVLKDLHVLGIGSYVKKVYSQSYLIVTTFRTGVKMADRILSKGLRISCKSLIVDVICLINLFTFIYLIWLRSNCHRLPHFLASWC